MGGGGTKTSLRYEVSVYDSPIPVAPWKCRIILSTTANSWDLRLLLAPVSRDAAVKVRDEPLHFQRVVCRPLWSSLVLRRVARRGGRQPCHPRRGAVFVSEMKISVFFRLPMSRMRESSVYSCNRRDPQTAALTTFGPFRCRPGPPQCWVLHVRCCCR